MSFKLFARNSLPPCYRKESLNWKIGSFFELKGERDEKLGKIIHKVTNMDSTRVVSNITGTIYYKSECILIA